MIRFTRIARIQLLRAALGADTLYVDGARPASPSVPVLELKLPFGNAGNDVFLTDQTSPRLQTVAGGDE